MSNDRTKSGDNLYVWQSKDWPRWQYNAKSLMPLLAQVHQALGHLLGRMHDQGMSSQDQASLEALTADVLKTSEIEGEHLDAETVRASIVRRLGVDVGALGAMIQMGPCKLFLGRCTDVVSITKRHHHSCCLRR